MKKNVKRNLMIMVGLGISVFLLYSLFKDIEFVKLWVVLKGANYIWLLPNVMLIIVSMYQRAFRWRTMLAPVKQVAFSNLIAATCIGFMANNILPLRLGEFVRAYSLSSQDKDISKSSSLANIFVERMVFDLTALLMIFGLVLGFFGMPWDDQFQFGLSVAVSIAVIGLIFILIMALKPKQASRLMIRYLSFLPDSVTGRIDDIVHKFSRGLEFLTDIKMVFSVAVQTILIWALMGISNYFVFLAFGFDLPISASYVLLVIVSVAILVPSSPGFVGVYHMGVVWTLTSYGISREDSLSFALVLHATQYLSVTLMGLYYLKKEHLTFKEIEDVADGELA